MMNGFGTVCSPTMTPTIMHGGGGKTLYYYYPQYFMEFSFSLFFATYYWHFVDWVWFCVFLVYVA